MAAKTFEEWWTEQLKEMEDKGLKQAFIERECDHMVAAVAWHAATYAAVEKFTSTNTQIMPCFSCVNSYMVCRNGFQIENKLCPRYEERTA